jgi:hypothetical protein
VTARPVESIVANSGTNFAELGPVGSEGVLSQMLLTTVGQEYEISWYLAVGNLAGQSSPNDFKVTWGGVPVYSATDLPSSASYTKYSVTAVATAPTTTISFGFRDDPDFLFLDDTVVTAAPEPSYFVATGLGLAALFLVKKRRFA